MRLRSDLNAYLYDLKLSGLLPNLAIDFDLMFRDILILGQFSTALVRMVLSNSMGSGKQLYQEFIAKEQDANKIKKKHAQLVSSHQKLREDYQKLIGKN